MTFPSCLAAASVFSHSAFQSAAADGAADVGAAGFASEGDAAAGLAGVATGEVEGAVVQAAVKKRAVTTIAHEQLDIVNIGVFLRQYWSHVRRYANAGKASRCSPTCPRA